MSIRTKIVVAVVLLWLTTVGMSAVLYTSAAQVAGLPDLITDTDDQAGPLRSAAGYVAGNLQVIALVSPGVSALVVLAVLLVLLPRFNRQHLSLMKGIAGLTGGELQTRVSVIGMDELGELAKAFNEMADELQRVTVDKSEMEAALARWRDTQAQLLHAQKMDAVGRLAGGVAHDFNNLLSVIFSATEMSLASVPPDHPSADDLRDVLDAARRARDLTRQLLAFSRPDHSAPRIVDLGEMLMTMHKMLRRMLPEDIELVTVPTPTQCVTRIDPSQFEQVLINLVVNARDAMSGGGVLTIRVTTVAVGEDEQREVTGVVSGNYVMVTVRDTGTGIDPQIEKSIFEPFFTTKARDKGSGLGLSTCYGIIQQAEGQIIVNSEPGQGTVFTIYLPWLEDVSSVSRSHLVGWDFSGGQETIMVVEDEPALRRVASRVLTSLGYEVTQAENGAVALRALTEASLPPDLLLTDVVMPQMGGPELAKAVRKRYPELKILFMSGYTDLTAADLTGQKGTGFIQKPFTPTTLGKAIRKVIEGESITNARHRQIS